MTRRRLLPAVLLASLILISGLFGAGDISAKISFEQTVCDLGRVGLGSKNSCEFKFTNTGQGPLKITNVKSACGCTVALLDKKEYAPDESGTIEVTYTAPNTTAATQKSIYVSSNDKANPNVRLTIKARARRGCPWHIVAAARVCGVTNGVGGIWLRMGGEEREERIQKAEFRRQNDEVRLPRARGPRNDVWGGETVRGFDSRAGCPCYGI